MKRVFLLFFFALTFLLSWTVGTVHAAGGDLDPSFGHGGKVFAGSPSGGQTLAFDATIDPLNGKIIAVGEDFNGPLGTIHMVMARFNSSGTLDTTFGAGGWVDASFGYLKIVGKAIARQSDGKLVVAGSVYQQGTSWIAVARFTSNGSVDGTFGSNGVKVFKMGSGYEEATDVAVQTDGKIVLTSAFSSQGKDEFGVIRLNSNGSYDSTWGILGLAIADFGFFDYPDALVIQPDGRIVVCGYSETSMGGDMAWSVARFNTNGWLDTSFSSDGKMIIDMSQSWDEAFSVAIQSDGRLLVSGKVNGLAKNFGLARISPTGTIEFSLVNNFPNYANEESHSVRAAINGRIISAGVAYPGVNAGSFAMSCHTSTGTLDTSFGTSGRVVTDMAVYWDEINKILLQHDGKIVVVGWAEGSNEIPRFALARYFGCGL